MWDLCCNTNGWWGQGSDRRCTRHDNEQGFHLCNIGQFMLYNIVQSGYATWHTLFLKKNSIKADGKKHERQNWWENRNWEKAKTKTHSLLLLPYDTTTMNYPPPPPTPPSTAVLLSAVGHLSSSLSPLRQYFFSNLMNLIWNGFLDSLRKIN